MLCVRALSHAGAQASPLETATEGELWLLHRGKSLSERIQRVSEQGRGAADGSVSPGDRLSRAHTLRHLRPLPQEPPGRSRTGKDRKTVLGEEEEAERDVQEGQKVPGSWKSVRRERHGWKNPKDIKRGRRFSLHL